MDKGFFKSYCFIVALAGVFCFATGLGFRMWIAFAVFYLIVWPALYRLF